MRQRRNHRASIGGWVPAWALSAGAAAIAAGGIAVLHPSLPWVVAVVVLAAVGSVFPRSMASWLPLLFIALALLAEDASPWRTALALFATHVVHACASLTSVMRANTRIALAALRPTTRRFAALQLSAQLVALVLAAVAGLVDARFAGAAVGAAVLIAALTLAVTWRFGARRT